MAIINRSKICSLLESEKDFKQIIEDGNNNNINFGEENSLIFNLGILKFCEYYDYI